MILSARIAGVTLLVRRSARRAKPGLAGKGLRATKRAKGDVGHRPNGATPRAPAKAQPKGPGSAAPGFVEALARSPATRYALLLPAAQSTSGAAGST
ncbi:MAG: hypothetical protein WAN51_01760 [Alphaproteobacteria bacterium]